MAQESEVGAEKPHAKFILCDTEYRIEKLDFESLMNLCSDIFSNIGITEITRLSNSADGVIWSQVRHHIESGDFVFESDFKETLVHYYSMWEDEIDRGSGLNRVKRFIGQIKNCDVMSEDGKTMLFAQFAHNLVFDMYMTKGLYMRAKVHQTYDVHDREGDNTNVPSFEWFNNAKEDHLLYVSSLSEGRDLRGDLPEDERDALLRRIHAFSLGYYTHQYHSTEKVMDFFERLSMQSGIKTPEAFKLIFGVDSDILALAILAHDSTDPANTSISEEFEHTFDEKLSILLRLTTASSRVKAGYIRQIYSRFLSSSTVETLDTFIYKILFEKNYSFLDGFQLRVQELMSIKYHPQVAIYGGDSIYSPMSGYDIFALLVNGTNYQIIGKNLNSDPLIGLITANNHMFSIGLGLVAFFDYFGQFTKEYPLVRSGLLRAAFKDREPNKIPAFLADFLTSQTIELRKDLRDTGTFNALLTDSGWNLFREIMEQLGYESIARDRIIGLDSPTKEMEKSKGWFGKQPS